MLLSVTDKELNERNHRNLGHRSERTVSGTAATSTPHRLDGKDCPFQMWTPRKDTSVTEGK